MLKGGSASWGKEGLLRVPTEGSSALFQTLSGNDHRDDAQVISHNKEL